MGFVLDALEQALQTGSPRPAIAAGSCIRAFEAAQYVSINTTEGEAPSPSCQKILINLPLLSYRQKLVTA